MLDIERRRLTLSGAKASEVNAAMKGFAEFYDLYAAERHDARAGDRAHSRPRRDLVRRDPRINMAGACAITSRSRRSTWKGAWERVNVPTLIVWGEYDWIMGRDEGERAAAILQGAQPALVTYVVRPGMDHHFEVYADPRKAFIEENGTYDAGAASLIVEWLRKRN